MKVPQIHCLPEVHIYVYNYTERDVEDVYQTADGQSFWKGSWDWGDSQRDFNLLLYFKFFSVFHNTTECIQVKCMKWITFKLHNILWKDKSFCLHEQRNYFHCLKISISNDHFFTSPQHIFFGKKGSFYIYLSWQSNTIHIIIMILMPCYHWNFSPAGDFTLKLFVQIC